LFCGEWAKNIPRSSFRQKTPWLTPGLHHPRTWVQAIPLTTPGWEHPADTTSALQMNLLFSSPRSHSWTANLMGQCPLHFLPMTQFPLIWP
jgi:hypothetical protein